MSFVGILILCLKNPLLFQLKNKENKMIDVTEKLLKAHITYNYCGMCGRVPKENEEPNYAPLRWWDCDDGWKIGSLCRWCAQEVLNEKPKEEDYAFRTTNGFCDNENTDEDILEVFDN
jgi:hypothetical protein